MKAFEIMDALFADADRTFDVTCDTCKAGDPNTEVHRIAVSMFATPNVIRRAAEWGADLLIVHEPTYYDHMDGHTDEKIQVEKRKLLTDSGLTVYRYHDHAHHTVPDTICEGEVDAMALDGAVSYGPRWDEVWITLRTPTTPRELARQIAERTGMAHIRVCGCVDVPCTRVVGMFGTPPKVFETMQTDECEVMMTGEACEWRLGEYARDAAELGHKKALLILGHIGSERDGMKLLARRLSGRYPAIESRYFECGEVYAD